jgi:hypothetical protein
MIRALLAAVLALAVLATPARAAEPLLQLVSEHPYELHVDSDSPKVHVPVGFVADVDDLLVRVVSARLGDQERPDVVDSFQPELVAESETRGAAIVVTVRTVRPTLQQGSYDVLLDVVRRDDPDRRQRIALEIVHPAASLRPVSTLQIRRRDDFLFFGGGKTTSPPLTLRETAGRSRLTDVAVLQVDLPSSPHDGKLRFDDAGTIRPRKQGRLDYTLSGSFPIGTSTGALDVEAPQLAAAVPVAYEIRHQRNPWWIPVLVLLGVGTSFLLRHLLSTVVDRNEARLRISALKAQLAKEVEERPDVGYGNELRGIVAKVDTALGEKDPPTLVAAERTAQEEFASARADYDRRRGAAQAALAKTETVVATPWRLPATVAAVVAEARTRLGEAEETLKTGDIGAAETAAREVERDLAEQVRDSADAWCGEARAFLDALATVPVPLRESVASARAEVDAALPAALLGSAQPDAQALLAGVHSAHRAVELLRRDVLPALGEILSEFQTLLTGKASEDSLTTLERARAELSSDSGQAVKAAVVAAEAALRTTESAQSPEAQAKLNGMLERGELLQAAREMGTAPDRDRGERAPGWVSGPRVPVDAADVPTPAPVIHTTITERVLTADAAAARRWRAEIFRADALRTVLIAVILAAAGYAAFQGKFDGTVPELIAVFFWGLGLDFSVQSALEATGQPPRTSA